MKKRIVIPPVSERQADIPRFFLNYWVTIHRVVKTMFIGGHTPWARFECKAELAVKVSSDQPEELKKITRPQIFQILFYLATTKEGRNILAASRGQEKKTIALGTFDNYYQSLGECVFYIESSFDIEHDWRELNFQVCPVAEFKGDEQTIYFEVCQKAKTTKGRYV